MPGHWEGDLVCGAFNRSAIATLVERTSAFLLLVHLNGKHDAATVRERVGSAMSVLPPHLRKSLIWDQGSEMAEYVQFQKDTMIPVYFCDPHSPWQRGSNENANGLLRFWFEKGSDLSSHSAADLKRVAATLNRRPRPTLGLETPANRLAQLLTAAQTPRVA